MNRILIRTNFNGFVIVMIYEAIMNSVFIEGNLTFDVYAGKDKIKNDALCYIVDQYQETDEYELTINKIKIPSLSENIRIVESFIDNAKEAYQLNDDIYGNIMVAVTESVNNAIKHGNESNKDKNPNLDAHPDCKVETGWCRGCGKCERQAKKICFFDDPFWKTIKL